MAKKHEMKKKIISKGWNFFCGSPFGTRSWEFL